MLLLLRDPEVGPSIRGAGTSCSPASVGSLFKPLRQIVESVNRTLKGQLDSNVMDAAHPPVSTPASPNASWR